MGEEGKNKSWLPGEEELGEDEKKIKENALRILVGAVAHPLAYAKTLVQVGFEPIPLTRDKAWIFVGRDTYFLPNIFKYMRHIYRCDGFLGLYCGVGANVCNIATNGFVNLYATKLLDKYYPEKGDENSEEPMEDMDAFQIAWNKTVRECAAKAVATIAARPFQVVMVRMMVQYVGKENVYRTVIGSIIDIGNNEGLPGLFGGIVPNLCFELGGICLLASLEFAVDRIFANYVLDADDEDSKSKELMKKQGSKLLPFIVNSLFYPLQLTATIMAVNQSGLAAGGLPFTPSFSHWFQCWDFLAAKNALKRGSKLVLRHYGGPVTIRGSNIYADMAYL